MKKYNFLIVLTLGLLSCSSGGSSSILSSSVSSNIEVSSDVISESNINQESSNVESSQEISSSTSSKEEVSSSSSKVSSSESSSKEEISSSFTSSSSIIESSSEKEVTYNPDGTKHLDEPVDTLKEVWSETETKYSFSNETFPTGFRYFYGNNLLNPNSFYATGEWKISVANSQARMGVQTPHFTSNKKLEIRLYISQINNSNNKVDDKSPWIRIYGFDKNGTLTQTKEVVCPSTFKNYENSKYSIYMSGVNVSYLEMRFVSAPYKGSQCYNFGISEIGFKAFPYEYTGD